MRKFSVKKFIIATVIAALITTAFSGCAFLGGSGGLSDILGSGGYTNSFIGENNTTQYLLTDIDEITLIVGKTETVQATVSEDPESKDFSRLVKVDWESENTGVAIVDEDGVITAVAVGKTNVFAKLSDKVKKKVSVDVQKKELTGLEITNARKSFLYGKTFVADFTLIAIFNGKYREVVEPTGVDSSLVNMNEENDYFVNVWYVYEDSRIEAHYEVSVKRYYEYDSDYLAHTYSDVYSNSIYSNLRRAYCPSEGEVNFLVIPVYFTDSFPFYVPNKAQGKADLEKAFFGESKSNGWNSVKTYYETASDGKLTINGTVSDWYEPDKSASYYGSGDNVDDLAKAAVNWFFTANPGENRADYDYDGNGTLDGVAIIYGCPDELYLNYWGKVIRPADPETPNIVNPTLGFFMWASFRDLYTDTDVIHGRNEVDSHVYIHETGHFFGLADYYDYGSNNYSPAGGFITMEYNTGGQDPFSCLALGWAKAIVPKTSCTVNLKDFQGGHEVIVLSPTPETFESPFDEYIIIELYSPTGLNKFDTENMWNHNSIYQGVAAAGIRIWHVDARLTLGTFVPPDSVAWSTTLYTDPTVGKVEVAFTNSWDAVGRISVLGSSYQDYSLLFYIRNDDATDYRPSRETNLTETTLFKAGDTFSVSEYYKQFVNGAAGKLNCDIELGWSVEIESITGNNDTGYTATINLTFAD